MSVASKGFTEHDVALLRRFAAEVAAGATYVVGDGYENWMLDRLIATGKVKRFTDERLIALGWAVGSPFLWVDDRWRYFDTDSVRHFVRGPSAWRIEPSPEGLAVLVEDAMASEGAA